MVNKKVTTIPATISKFNLTPINEVKKEELQDMPEYQLIAKNSKLPMRHRLTTIQTISKVERIGSSYKFIQTKEYQLPTPKSVMVLNEW